MSGIGVWEAGKSVTVDEEKLKHYVKVMQGADPDNLAAHLSDDDIKGDAMLMKQPETAWHEAVQLGDTELAALIRFFTLAEMQLSGWDGGKQSPVIYLVKILKSRDAFTPELRKWIKANTDNRYLPYGSAL